MKTALFTVLALAFAVNASAATKVTFTHARYKSQRSSADERRLGQFNINYVQILPALGQSLSPSQLKVNKILKEDALSSPCGVGGATSDNISDQETNISTDVTFISPRLLALSQAYDSYCGGAHPDNGSASKIYDLDLAIQIDIRTGKEPSYENPSITQKAIDAVILSAMKAQAQKEIAARGPGDDCNETYSQLSFYAEDITLTPKALVVQNSVPHAELACQFVTTIPLTAFTKVAPKGSLLAELAAGAAKLNK